MIIDKKIFIVCLLLLLVGGCSDFLGTPMDDRAELRDLKTIEELLVSAYPGAFHAPFLEARGEDIEDVGSSSGNLNPNYNEDAFFWRDTQTMDGDTPNNYWRVCYIAIAAANQALQTLEEKGFKGEHADRVRGEALMCRAHAHFMLVSIWGEAYNTSTSGTDLGVPYVTEVEDEPFKTYKRLTVKQVYDKIEQDIINGLPLLQNKYEKPRFHFTLEAGNALAVKFYLNKGDWDKVIEHADKVFSMIGLPLDVTRNWISYRTNTHSEIRLRYCSVDEPVNLLIMGSNTSHARFYARYRFKMNNNLSKLTDSKNIGSSDGSWNYPVYGREGYKNIPKFQEYFKITNPLTGLGEAYSSFVALSADEVLLSRSEAYVMKGELSKALDDINSYLSTRTGTTAGVYTDITLAGLKNISVVGSNTTKYSPFYELPSGDAFKLIDFLMEARKREYAQEGNYWFVIKRMHIAVEHVDENKDRYTLSKDDKRRVLQIPELAIDRGLKPTPR